MVETKNRRAAVASRAVAAWNRDYPPGTPVDYFATTADLESGRVALPTVTRSEAELLGGHTPVVFLAGISGCVALTHVIAKPVLPPAAETTARPAAKLKRQSAGRKRRGIIAVVLEFAIICAAALALAVYAACISQSPEE